MASFVGATYIISIGHLKGKKVIGIFEDISVFPFSLALQVVHQLYNRKSFSNSPVWMAPC
jgi:hypothetical protein